MRKLLIAILCLAAFFGSRIYAQSSNSNRQLPEPGSFAPELKLAEILQAPNGAKADWKSLRGKVVVVEFWFTHCPSCLVEIPAWNALATKVDPAKVQMISVTNDASAVVEEFLKKKPILGWIGIDPSSAVFDRYNVEAFPVTVVVGPDGRIISTHLHAGQLSGEKLMHVAEKR